MQDDDLDRVLSREEDIVPSSGFAGNVMDAVRSQASAPPPIPFPWGRAIPGLAAALGLLLVVAVRFGSGSEAPAGNAALLVKALEAATTFGVGWIALALFASFVSVALSMRLAGGRR
ncbi:hypothetical protein SBA4_1610015 [Candidatus Sulfopaludibacter sp. SbA4]|nr:hypothetical protein SBA4_1610015 [Candidatus Sulfopaludibacter sp. SbA4]